MTGNGEVADDVGDGETLEPTGWTECECGGILRGDLSNHCLRCNKQLCVDCVPEPFDYCPDCRLG